MCRCGTGTACHLWVIQLLAGLSNAIFRYAIFVQNFVEAGDLTRWRIQNCHIRKWVYVLALTGPAYAVASCAPYPYDKRTDALTTSLQSDTDALLVNLTFLDQQISDLQGKSDPTTLAALDRARQAASYDANLPSYNQIKLDLATLKIRVAAENKADTQLLGVEIGHVEDLLFGRGSLSATHQSDGVVERATIVRYQSALDAQFATMLNYEINGPPQAPPDTDESDDTSD